MEVMCEQLQVVLHALYQKQQTERGTAERTDPDMMHGKSVDLVGVAFLLDFKLIIKKNIFVFFVHLFHFLFNCFRSGKQQSH